MIYYNLRTGRKVERHEPDPWLEASDGWARLWQPPVVEPTPGPDNEPSIDGDKEEV